MTYVEIDLEAQAINALGTFTSTNDIYSGIDQTFTGNPSASALRFPLPVAVPWNDGITITQANLVIRGKIHEVFPGSANDSNNLVSILNSASQVLPTTAAGVSAATPMTERATIGTNAYMASGYALDYTLTTTYASVSIDLLEVFQAAQLADILTVDSEDVVILIKAIAYKSYGGIRIDGLGLTAPPVLELEYAPTGDDIVDLALIDIYIAEDGETAFVEFNSPVYSPDTPTATMGFGLSASGGAVSLTLVDGYTEVGTPDRYLYEFSLSRQIYADETVTASYADPPLLYSSAVWDTAPSIGDPLAPFTGYLVDNLSNTLLAEPEQAETLSEGNEPRLRVQVEIGNIDPSETVSEGNDPSFQTLSGVLPSETVSEGSEPIIRLLRELGVIAPSQTVSESNEVTLDSYLVLSSPENAETLSLGNSPRLRLAGRVDRSLIPHNLIPGKTWLTF